MPKHTLISPRKISNIFRPSTSSKETNRYEPQDISAEARKLLEKNELILSRECDRNNNRNKPEAEHEGSGSDASHLEQTTNLANEVLHQIQAVMKSIVSVAMNDPSLLKTCCEIIEAQTRADEFMHRVSATSSEFKPVVERPLEWDLKCTQELNTYPATRIQPQGEFTEENTALKLQQIIEIVSRDLGVIKNFVQLHQCKDDYLFLQVTEAYRRHLFELIEALTTSDISDKQLYSVLLFIGDFRQKFPRSEFSEFWHESDDHVDLSIISDERKQELTRRYEEKQSRVIKNQMNKGLEVEYRDWLEGAADGQGLKIVTTLWPADVAQLCDENLQVARQMSAAVYKSIHEVLQKELVPHAIKLYADGVKYYIHPCKLSYGAKSPELLTMTKRRKKIEQDSLSKPNPDIMHAILNGFSLLHRHLDNLSKKYPSKEPERQFFNLHSLVRAQSLECVNHYKKHVFRPAMKKHERRLMADEWFPDSTIRDQLCDDVIAFTKALDQQYFSTWFEEVRLTVHQTYLRAMCRNCKHIKCENPEQRTHFSDRLIVEKKTIEGTIRENFPNYQDEYIKLLQQIADVIDSTDQESCQTSIAILKHTQQDIISKKHLKAILTVHGKFASRNKKIIGSLYRSDT